MNTQIQTENASKFSREELREAIMTEYKAVACDPNHTIHFTSGRKLAKRLGYTEDIMSQIPESAIRPFAGVGNPFHIDEPPKGSKILDIGSGCGFDSIYASILTHRSIMVTGVDMTEEMLEQARKNAIIAECTNIQFVKGYAEDLPIPSESMDLVISNGVINLCLDKEQVYKEIHRVLRPGGEFRIADVMLDIPVPETSKELIHLWTNCVAGAVTKTEYREYIKNAGFIWMGFGMQYDVFHDAKIAKSAAYFGAKGQNILGIKKG
ncbi:methyltransferase domain-containing protein [Aquiflexum sp.]|uniref:methyltransferase domain-containing protein n=1 Tax=Aquiflexum sp. TaxID=1872584 RepID=UPI0035949199